MNSAQAKVQGIKKTNRVQSTTTARVASAATRLAFEVNNKDYCSAPKLFVNNADIVDKLKRVTRTKDLTPEHFMRATLRGNKPVIVWRLAKNLHSTQHFHFVKPDTELYRFATGSDEPATVEERDAYEIVSAPARNLVDLFEHVDKENKELRDGINNAIKEVAEEKNKNRVFLNKLQQCNAMSKEFEKHADEKERENEELQARLRELEAKYQRQQVVMQEHEKKRAVEVAILEQRANTAESQRDVSARRINELNGKISDLEGRQQERYAYGDRSHNSYYRRVPY
jgi:hypothetical protein